MTMSKDLVKHLREWGLKVTPEPNWRNRSANGGFAPRAVFVHHDASSTSSGNWGARNIIVNGRPGIPGPLAQFVLARDGQVLVVSQNRANHAGTGGPKVGIPANSGNYYAWGIEAANNGVGEKWTKKQLNAYYRLCAALLAYMGTKDVEKVIGHKEWTSRKIDPAGINMNQFRAEVKKALADGPSVKTLSLSKLKPGKRNKHVLELKKALKKRGFFDGTMNNHFGKGLEVAVIKAQCARGVKNPNGVPGKKLLNQLGFRVKK